MRVIKVVDLSLALDEGTQVYPGDPSVRVSQAATIDDDGFNLLALELGSQSGTNVDAPFHFLAGGARIDEVPLELCVGRGVLLDVRGLADRQPIEDLDLTDVRPGDIALLHTGWPAHYGTPRYLDHPFLAASACQALLDAGVRTICLDTMNIDETPDAGHPGVGFPCHLLIARAGGLVVENLTGMERIDFPDPLVSVLPLRLTGADGSPARAVAIQLG